MPLTAKGEEIKNAMGKEYGAKKGEQVLYASKNAGTITGIDESTMHGESPLESIPMEVSQAEIAERNRKYWKQQTPQSPTDDEVITPTQGMGEKAAEGRS